MVPGGLITRIDGPTRAIGVAVIDVRLGVPRADADRNPTVATLT